MVPTKSSAVHNFRAPQFTIWRRFVSCLTWKSAARNVCSGAAGGMVTVERLNGDRAAVRRFVDLPFKLYRECPQWVPPVKSDVRVMLDPARHPFYEDSEADFFLARRDGCDVGRIAVLENRPFNAHHRSQEANFYLFECEDDPRTRDALLETAFGWTRTKGLTSLVGPKGLSPFDPYGILIEGFDRRQVMSMSAYHPAYYARLLETAGFEKAMDFASFSLSKKTFRMSERVKRVAERAQRRCRLKVQQFRSLREMLKWVEPLAEAYNASFAKNWEYYPLSRSQIRFAVRNLLPILDRRHIKLITCDDRVVGFLLAFPDVSTALQRMAGRLSPLALFRVWREKGATSWLTFNGAGLLPEFHGCGGNALLYVETEKSVQKTQFEHGQMLQIAESAVQMIKDLRELGAQPYQTHRVYRHEG